MKIQLKISNENSKDYETESKNLRKAVEYLERKLSKTTTTFEKKLLQLQTTNISLSMADTASQSIMQTENEGILSRELLYYKSANKNLKQKLRQVIQANHCLANKPMQDPTIIENDSRLESAFNESQIIST